MFAWVIIDEHKNIITSVIISILQSFIIPEYVQYTLNKFYSNIMICNTSMLVFHTNCL